MTPEEAKELQALKESVAAERAERLKLNERLALQDAGGAIADYYRTVTVAEGIRQRVTQRILSGSIPMTESRQLDTEKLKKLVESETNDELAYISRISGGRIVTGMGSTSVTPPSEEKVKEAAEARKQRLKESASLYGFGGKQHKVGRTILNEGRRAFDPTYNARENGGMIDSARTSLPSVEV